MAWDILTMKNCSLWKVHLGHTFTKKLFVVYLKFEFNYFYLFFWPPYPHDLKSWASNFHLLVHDTGILESLFPFQGGEPTQGCEGRRRVRVLYARPVEYLHLRNAIWDSNSTGRQRLQNHNSSFCGHRKLPRHFLFLNIQRFWTTHTNSRGTTLWSGGGMGMRVPGTILSRAQISREDIRMIPTVF